MSSRRLKWLVTAFVWSLVILLVVASALGWLLPGIRVLEIAAAAGVLAAGATFQAWLAE